MVTVLVEIYTEEMFTVKMQIVINGLFTLLAINKKSNLVAI